MKVLVFFTLRLGFSQINYNIMKGPWYLRKADVRYLTKKIHHIKPLMPYYILRKKGIIVLFQDYIKHF